MYIKFFFSKLLYSLYNNLEKKNFKQKYFLFLCQSHAKVKNKLEKMLLIALNFMKTLSASIRESWERKTGFYILFLSCKTRVIRVCMISTF